MTTDEETFGINVGGSARVRPPETMTSLAWRRFRRHPGAVVGAIVLTVLVLASILIGFIMGLSSVKRC